MSYLQKKLQKITFKTIPVYFGAVLLAIFAKPTLPFFLAGLALVIPGELIRIWAAGHLRKNQEVTTTGPYAYVKNPLYLGTLLIMIGYCLMARNLILLLIGLAVFSLYYVPFKRHRESARLQERFGDSWTEYDWAVPDYLPRLSPYPKRGAHPWRWKVFLDNSEHETAIVVLLMIILIGLRFWLR
ncbi:MAG TPA: isoprenylcysteine carboxylmethyltransferase family protein [Nitrospiria bacterium]|nr:isoprenylcysteine carboxylmethyltransferase family protein [Nitrospiria bacterium]